MAKLVWGLACGLLAAPAAQAQLSAETVEPRAYGYIVGDVVERHVSVHVPAGLVLDAASLPRAGSRGHVIELRDLQWASIADSQAGGGAQRIELRLRYQVFLAPPAVRTLELPPLALHFRGRPRDQDLRVDAWPLDVAPLLPQAVSPRRGLGEMQPDIAPPSIDTAPTGLRLAAALGALGLLLGGFGYRRLVRPWLDRHRPLEQCWRRLRAQGRPGSPAQRQAMWRELHAALNQTAGQVLFVGGVDAFVASQPAFAGVSDELRAFFAHSQRLFFADPAARADAPDHAHHADRDAWLLGLCRRLRDAERASPRGRRPDLAPVRLRAP